MLSEKVLVPPHIALACQTLIEISRAGLARARSGCQAGCQELDSFLPQSKAIGRGFPRANGESALLNRIDVDRGPIKLQYPLY